MSSEDTYLQHLPTLELSQFQKRGNKLLQHSITILPTSDGFITTSFSISEWSKNIKTVIHTYTVSSSFKTSEYVFKTLDGLMHHYINNGKIDGFTVIQIFNAHEAQEHMYSRTS